MLSLPSALMSSVTLQESPPIGGSATTSAAEILACSCTVMYVAPVYD